MNLLRQLSSSPCAILPCIFIISVLIGSTRAGSNLSLTASNSIPKASSTPSQCPDILAKKCTCGIIPYGTAGRPTYVTNCTNAGFHTTPQLYLQQISNQTEVLIFTGNNFTELPANLLVHNQTYDQLHLVDLSNNSIQTIHGKAFHNMKSVRILYLNHNNLSIFLNPATASDESGQEESHYPRMFASLKNLDELYLKDAFDHRHKVHGQALMSALGEVFRKSNISNLKKINLESNGISTIGSEDFFCALPGLQSIQLAYNSLTSYQINASCLPWLNYVDVSSNFITTVDNRSISLIMSSGSRVGKLHLNISSNPFRCDCALLNFFRFVKNSTSENADPRTTPKLENLDQFRCSRNSVAMDIKGKYFDDLSEQDFDCNLDPLSSIHDPALIQERNEAIRRYRHYITLSYCILVFLLLLLAFLIGVLVYTNREYLLNTWNYFLIELNPKSDYTALDKDAPAGTSSGAARENSHLGSHEKRKRHKQRSHIRMREEDESGVAEEQV